LVKKIIINVSKKIMINTPEEIISI